MTPLRTYITLLAIVCTAAIFFVALVLHVSPDLLSVVATVIVWMIAIKDIRFLLAGWFLVSPYFFGEEGEPNVAANVSYNFIVPIIALVILWRRFLKERKLSFAKVDLVWIAFIIYAVLSSFYATRGRYDDVRMIYLNYAIPFLLFAAIKNIHIDSKLFRMFAYVAVFHLVVLSLMFVYEQATGETIYRTSQAWADVGSSRRFAGPFGSPIILGVFVPIVFLYIYTAFRFDELPRFVVWISALVSAVLVIATFTRSVWLGAFLAFVYIVYKTGREGKAKLLRLAAFAIVAVAIVGVITIASPAVQERVAGQENVNFRVVMAQASLHMIADKPIVGWGAGTFDEVSDRYLFDALGVYITKDTSHVTLLTILAELGILGASLYLLFILSNLIYRKIRAAELPVDDQLIVAVNVGGVIAFTINAFLIDMRFYSIAYSWFFINLGFIYSMYRDFMLTRTEQYG